jgi:Transcriptional regulator, AbiEi antitoxin
VNPRRSTHLLCGQLHVRAAVSDDEAIGGLASRQRGVVSRGQLLELGVSGRAIDHRLSVGRLRRLFPGVYAVGHGALAFPGRMLAAVAATAPGAAASHLSAAALWGLAEPPEGWPHVTVARSRRARRGLVIHRARLPEEDRTIVSGIPATRVPRTMLDLSATLGKPALRRLISEAEFMGLTCVADLEAILTRYPRRRGRRTLAEIVEANLEGAGRTRSELEDRFLELCRRYGFPMPETNVPVEARTALRGRLRVARCEGDRRARRIQGTRQGSGLPTRPRSRPGADRLGLDPYAGDLGSAPARRANRGRRDPRHARPAVAGSSIHPRTGWVNLRGSAARPRPGRRGGALGPTRARRRASPGPRARLPGRPGRRTCRSGRVLRG